ncbi:aminoacylase-1 isoform X1 [Anoplophora glabripennis]|uniref:N-acyl-aliphatic-L-amino acid amidohydrolase n=1 Tax=Anoplophora glabripennis TaxID=217634 RepID=V5G640_ANOGL|nr:aminoacylase-1 isoform X1 [Anoplophora glabripennis]XP_018568193.1 aminoacylase-1 isoform X1 [Anoplophora glabripennis]
MSSLSADQRKALDTQAVNNFREYLQIPSVQPDINYDDCVTFLKKQAKSLGLPIKVIEITSGKPIVIITWEGSEPDSPTILLNSHMDVVPVFEDKWTYKPFSAHIDKKGNIYARGSQDMKCVGIQYLEAVRRLKLQGVTLRRTLHISFVPDEEIGGVEGMRKFVHTNEFRDLNVAFALDEGMANPTEEFALFYAERCIWHMHIHCPGNPGHGSLLLDNTAGEKVNYILNKFFEFRRREKQKLAENPTLTVGDVTTVNLTQMKGGIQTNVIPPEFVIVVDCRIPITVDIKKWEETINRWCSDAGQGVRIEYEQKQPQVPATKLDNTNPFWIAFKEASDELGLKLKPQVFPGGTDSRYVRSIGLPALGFSPMNKTPIRLHDHDEYLSKTMFLRGIDIYCKIIENVANVEERSG